MKNKIYQLVSFANGFNKRTKQWENLRSVKNIYIGSGGLKTAHFEYNKELNEVRFYENGYNGNKYSEVRVKVEIHTPHIHEDGSLAYYGDKIIQSYNPSNV